MALSETFSGGRSFIRHRPAAPLDRYVECLWWSRRDQSQNFCEHMLPSGTVHAIFALHDSPFTCRSSPYGRSIVWSGSVVHGPQWNYYFSGPKPSGTVVGVSFHPGAAGVVLGLPVTELEDDHVSLGTLWGRRAEQLRERLTAAGEPQTAFRVLERELAARVQRPFLMHPAITHALARSSPEWPYTRVSDVQYETGHSPRHFIALFRSALGLTPKHYYRLKRFAEALRRLAAKNAPSLAEIAASLGYSDQAHFTREFREFAGLPPTQYRPAGMDSIFHHRCPP